MRRVKSRAGLALAMALMFGPGAVQAQDRAHSPFAEQIYQRWSAYVDASLQVVTDLPPDDGTEGTRCRSQILRWLEQAREHAAYVQMYLNLDELIPDTAARETLRAYFARLADDPPVLRMLAHHDVRQACEARGAYLMAFDVLTYRYDTMIEAMQAAPE